MDLSTAGERRLRSILWKALENCTELPLEDAIEQVLRGAAADKTLELLLRRHRHLAPDERTVVAEVLFGIGLWRRRIAWGLGITPWQSLDAKRALEGLLCLAGHAAHPDWRPELPDTLADRHSLPDWLAREITDAFADQADAFAEALNTPGPIGLRANTLQTSRAALKERLAAEGIEAHEGRWAADALIIDTPRPNILGSASHQQGHFEVQDEGSQRLGELVGAKPGERVLDFCAGAGGKTLQLGAAMKNEGSLHAYDVDHARLDRLRVRATRAGLRHLSIHVDPPSPPLDADRVLVDAPCSELGALRRGPDLRFRLSPERFIELPALQLDILAAAAQHTKRGGRLVYATCTFRRAENDDVARAFEARHPDFHRVERFTCAPHAHGTDAFFAVVYERR